MSWRRLVAPASSSTARRRAFLELAGCRFNHGKADNPPPFGESRGPPGKEGRSNKQWRGRSRNEPANAQDAPVVSSRWKFVQAAAKLEAMAKGEAPKAADVTTVDMQRPAYVKTKALRKTAGFIMQILNKEAVLAAKKERDIPVIKPGYVVQLKVEVPANKRKIQEYKGLVMGIHKNGIHTTFRIRRKVGGLFVENVLPLYSPHIKEWKVLDRKKVHRAKLYYIRDGKWKLKSIVPPPRKRGDRGLQGAESEPQREQQQEQSIWPDDEPQGQDSDGDAEVADEVATGQQS